MKEIYLGRQPVYDSAFRVEGYELFYHPTDIGNTALLDGELTGSHATAGAPLTDSTCSIRSIVDRSVFENSCDNQGNNPEANEVVGPIASMSRL